MDRQCHHDAGPSHVMKYDSKRIRPDKELLTGDDKQLEADHKLLILVNFVN